MESIYTYLVSHSILAIRTISPILIVLILWSVVWKGFGLWFSARNYQRNWFIAILILNTFGLVEIIYLLWFRRDKKAGVTPSLFNATLPPPEDEDVVKKPKVAEMHQT